MRSPSSSPRRLSKAQQELANIQGNVARNTDTATASPERLSRRRQNRTEITTDQIVALKSYALALGNVGKDTDAAQLDARIKTGSRRSRWMC